MSNDADAERVAELARVVVADHDPKKVPAQEYLGACYDAGLSWVHSKVDDFVAGFITFDNDSRTSLRGRLGVRAGWAGNLAPYIDAKLLHEFKGSDTIGVVSGSLIDSIETATP